MPALVGVTNFHGTVLGVKINDVEGTALIAYPTLLTEFRIDFGRHMALPHYFVMELSTEFHKFNHPLLKYIQKASAEKSPPPPPSLNGGGVWGGGGAPLCLRGRG